MGTCCGKQKVTFKKGESIADVKSKIRPLDLILFRGSEFVSDTISLIEKIRLGKGEWTHVGIVITPDIVPIKNSVPGKLYVWESTMSGKKLGDGVNNVETNKATFGVQMRDLEDVVDKYDNDPDTRIGWAQLINNPLVKKDDEDDETYNKRKEKISEILTEFDRKTGNATYDYNLCNLCSTMCYTGTCVRRTIFGHSNKYFCSELVAQILKIIGVIPKNIESEQIAPEEFLGKSNSGLKAVVQTPVVITRVWKQPEKFKWPVL